MPGCREKAGAVFWMSRGCVAFPHHLVQALCAHHEFRSEPLGSMVLLRVVEEP